MTENQCQIVFALFEKGVEWQSKKLSEINIKLQLSTGLSRHEVVNLL